jgi:hypothetical protein
MQGKAASAYGTMTETEKYSRKTKRRRLTTDLHTKPLVTPGGFSAG